jgi:trehalose 6-phosphate synthase
MVSRLIVVSNRVAVPTSSKAPAAGGLAVGVKAALKKQPGIWFGWSGKASDTPDTEVQFIERNKVTFAVIDLASDDFQEYYNGFANRVLWPILHYRVDLAEYSRTDLSGYMRVNRIFADRLSKIIGPEDVIWVHDYHLMPMAKELRAKGHDNPIGFFLHVPCPPTDILDTLPRHPDSIGALSYYDLVGFQTDNDRDNFGHYLLQQGAIGNRDNTSFEVEGRTTRIGTFPIGIETAVFARAARNAARSPFVQEIKTSLAGRRLIVGVDRLDYSKGLTNRVEGFDRFLQNDKQAHGQVTLLQITPTSRVDIQEYAEMHRSISKLVGEVNGRHGEAAWTPIRYINRSYSRTALGGIFRLADVALVTPLRDGMNLVAKEFVAAQDREDPGVLILSQFAGAAGELDGALLINPHESDAFPGAIRRALNMPIEERRERHARMFEHIAKYDIDHWAMSFLAALADTRKKSGLLNGLRSFFAQRAQSNGVQDRATTPA